MSLRFSEKDIDKITETLGIKPESLGNAWSWRLSNEQTGQSLVFTVNNDIALSKGYTGPLVSVQTQQGYYELHDCLGYVIFEPDEVIMIKADEEFVCSLIVGRQCTCSMYANISRDILNADFTTLDPAVLLSAMQLSLTETILP